MTKLEMIVKEISKACRDRECCRGCEYDSGLCEAAILIDRLSGKFPDEWIRKEDE